MLDPRHYQRDFLRAINQEQNVVSIIHRRAGKDTISMQAILLRALKRVGTHIYLAPFLTQIRQIIWQGMTHDGKPFLSYIPGKLVASISEARMELKLINGSVIKFAGSNNFDGLMGTNPVTIIYSEYSLHNPLARQYLNPILVENNGIEICQYTPRGMNHGFDLLNSVRDSDKYFTQVLGVDQTFKDKEMTIPVVTKEKIKEAKSMGMSDEMIRQEFYVDFEVGNMGAYFTSEITDMMNQGRAKPLAINPNLPLHSCWDLGGTDATAGWLFQIVGDHIHLMNILHNTGKGLKFYLEEAEHIRKSYGCQWGHHFMPHDVKQGHQGWENAESRLMQARKHGWFFQVTPKLDIEDGIEAMRFVLPKVRINMPTCDIGMRGLREYQRVWDDLKGCFHPTPLHNWASHIVDAFRYLSINYRRLFEAPQAMTTYQYDG